MIKRRLNNYTLVLQNPFKFYFLLVYKLYTRLNFMDDIRIMILKKIIQNMYLDLGDFFFLMSFFEKFFVTVFPPVNICLHEGAYPGDASF